jgi:hypothetical protein
MAGRIRQDMWALAVAKMRGRLDEAFISGSKEALNNSSMNYQGKTNQQAILICFSFSTTYKLSKMATHPCAAEPPSSSEAP